MTKLGARRQSLKNIWKLENSKKVSSLLLYLKFQNLRRIFGFSAIYQKKIWSIYAWLVRFALGIDTLAHQTALKIGLPTIVFPGSGLAEKSIYPKINTRMIKEIIEGGGCLLSEFEPDFSATLWGFPKRNRLMAGISKATLVIEATEKSGTLITARLALDYNRDLLAVPGSIFSPSSLGTNKLIQEGATSILSSEDLIEALDFKRPVDLKAEQNLQQNLSAEEKEIIKILKEPLPRDVLFQKLKMSSAEINSLLTLLEIKGIIKEEVGEIYLC